MRIIDLTQVADDAILDTHVLAIDDPSQTLKITVGQLKAFLGDAFVNIEGDTMTGELIIVNNAPTLTLKNEDEGGQILISAYQQSGAHRWFLGSNIVESSSVELKNMIAGGSVVLREDGGVSLWTQGAEVVVGAGGITLPPVINSLVARSFIDNVLPTLYGTPDFWGMIRTFETRNGIETMRVAWGPNNASWDIHTYSENNQWSGMPFHLDLTTGDLIIAGQVIPTNYANYDARYLRSLVPEIGGIGETALVALRSPGDYLNGWTIAGSAIMPASIQSDASGMDPDIITESAVTLYGTWRLTGTFASIGPQYLTKVTTAVRIA